MSMCFGGIDLRMIGLRKSPLKKRRYLSSISGMRTFALLISMSFVSFGKRGHRGETRFPRLQFRYISLNYQSLTLSVVICLGVFSSDMTSQVAETSSAVFSLIPHINSPLH